MKKILAITILTLSFVSLPAPAQSAQPSHSKNEVQPASTPQANVEVILETESGAVVKTVRTDAKGKFVFADLQPGNYRLKTGIVSPRDVATGQASGKQAQSSNAATPVSSPRDAATGQASGKRLATTENTAPDTDAEANRTINTSRSNIKNQRVAAEVIEGDDDTPPTKAGVSTSRSNIRTKQSLNAADNEEILAVQFAEETSAHQKRVFVLPHILEKSGLVVQVGATGQLTGHLLKTRHDTAKNAIGNIR